MNNNIFAMTFNVSWESLEAINSGRLNMKHCQIGELNICSDNISKIICQTSLYNNGNYYDFIGLQEINDSINQWETVKYKINNYDPTFLSKYNIILTKIGKAGIITMFNKKYNLLAKIEGNLNSNKDVRPFHILVFDQNIMYINLHMPHTNQDISIDILNNHLLKLTKSFPNLNLSKYNFIIGGDFNNNDPLILQNIKKLQKIFGKKILPEKNKLITCCSPKKNIKHNKSYDHIFSNLICLEYSTLDQTDNYNNDNNRMMSDHLPVFATFLKTNKHIQNKYMIEYDN